METPQESREADEKPNSMEDTLKEAMERMRRKHAMRTAGLLESTNESAPPEDEAVRTKPAARVSRLGLGGGVTMKDLRFSTCVVVVWLSLLLFCRPALVYVLER